MKAPVLRGIFPVLFAVLLTACDRGDLIVQTDPEDPVPSTSPLVTVVYDPDALGDRSYNDLIYKGIEEAAEHHGLRTMQLSPRSRDEGLAYLEVLFRELTAYPDTIRRLIIVTSTGYDDFIRQNNHLLEANPYADLLYLETSQPLQGKGSTLFLPYYGAMYEAGFMTPAFCDYTIVVGANPKDEPVSVAIKGFCDGFAASTLPRDKETSMAHLSTIWLADEAGMGYNAADTTILRIVSNVPEAASMFVPVCGGGSLKFRRYSEILFGKFLYMGIDQSHPSLFCLHAAVKHIDRALTATIEKWLSPEGMPKHQHLGLASGYTGMVIHPSAETYFRDFRNDIFTDTLAIVHEKAIRKEEELYGQSFIQ